MINALRPFMPVVVIGGTTYGKPVGQYGIPFCDKLLAPVSFALRNADGQGDFFDGFAPDCPAPDDADHQLGDPEEGSLKEALTFAATGACSAPAARRSQRRRALRGARLGRSDGSRWSTRIDRVPPRMNSDEILAARRRLIGGNVSIGYRRPVHIVRGWMQYLFDADGRRYLDAYNNVPARRPLPPARRRRRGAADARRSTPTRATCTTSLARYAERLPATLPEPLRVCYFVNSGSEANELALRLARAHTRRRDVIVLDAAYHGNTTTLIDISPYKFNGPGRGRARRRGCTSCRCRTSIADEYNGADDRRCAAGASTRTRVATPIDRLRSGRTRPVRLHRGKLPERRRADHAAARVPREGLRARARGGRRLHRRRSADRVRPDRHALLRRSRRRASCPTSSCWASRSATGIRSAPS